MASFFQIVHAMTGIGKNVFEDQSGASSTSLLSQASMNSLLPMDPTSTFSTSTMVDATSLLTGGMPIDPFSVMGSMGLDPTSLSLQYGCVLM